MNWRINFMFLLIAVPFLGFAQSYPFRKFTTADGLPHLQVRDLFIDESGFIWIATLGGIGIYDGKEMIEFRNVAQLSEEYVSSVSVEDGRVYFADKGKVTVVDGNRMSPVTRYQGKCGMGVISGMKTQNLYNCRDSIYRACGDSFVLSGTIPQSLLDKDQYFRTFGFYNLGYISNDGKWFWNLQPMTDSFALKRYPFIGFRKNTVGKGYQHVAGENGPMIVSIDNQYNPSAIYVSSNDSMVCVSQFNTASGKLELLHPAAPDFIFAQGWGPVYQKSGTSYELYKDFDISDVFSVLYDEDRMVFGTDGGVIVFFQNGLEDIPLTSCDYIWSAVPWNNNVLLNCHSGNVVALDSLLQETIIATSGNFVDQHGKILKNSFLSNFTTDGNIVLFGGFFGLVLLDDSGDFSVIPHHDHVEAMTYCEQTSTFYCGSRALYTFSPDSKSYAELPGSNNLVKELHPLNDLEVIGDTIWVGGASGIGRYSLTDSTDFQLYTSSDDFSCQISVSLASWNRQLLVGGSCGLFLYDTQSNRFQPIHPQVINRRVNQLSVTDDGLLIVLLSDHLYVLDLTQKGIPILTHFDPTTGLMKAHEPSENGSVVVDNRFVYLPHSQGIYRLDLDVVRKRKLPDFSSSIPYVRIREGDKEFILLKDEPLYLDKNSAEFRPMISFKYGLNWKFRFKRNAGEFSEWIDQNEFFVDNLRHGKNKVLFQAMDFSGRIVERLITVHAWEPFWKRPQTQNALLVSIFVMILGMVFFRFEYLKRIGKYRKDLDRNRLKTIQSLVNPHFLFNALTSLQYSILNKPRTESNESLLSLSRTFRTLISDKEGNSHGTKVIPLRKEIELVQDFAYLYNLQYERETTKILIDVHPDIQQDEVMVPQLMIEPFVENALKHAFGRDEKNKQIIVTINLDGSDLLVQVRDKGKGFNPKDDTAEESMGLKLARERFDLLRKLGFSCSLKIESRPGIGTTVSIKYKLS